MIIISIPMYFAPYIMFLINCHAPVVWPPRTFVFNLEEEITLDYRQNICSNV